LMSHITVIVVKKRINFKSNPSVFNKRSIGNIFAIIMIMGIYHVEKIKCLSQTVTIDLIVKPIVTSPIVFPPYMHIYKYSNNRSTVIGNKRSNH